VLVPTRSVAGPLALALSLLAAACSRDEVTHFRVPKTPEAAAPGDAASAAASGAAHQAPAPPPGMAGDVPAPPPPEHGLTWTLPRGWKEERSGGMRYATLKPNVTGRIDASVVVLPGPAGGELSNVNRWRGQIGLTAIDEGALARARKAVATRAGPLSVFDFTSEGQKRSRLIAGVLEAGGSTWFVKVTGDADAVAAARPDFTKLLESLRLE
jgi:hypothetical protein